MKAGRLEEILGRNGRAVRLPLDVFQLFKKQATLSAPLQVEGVFLKLHANWSD